MKQRIEELDALRGLAALSVVLFHYTLETEQTGSYFKVGCMGVDLFFIISGFVIFMTIQKSKNWKAFFVSRFSRLYPAYWMCVSITTLAIFFSIQIDSHVLEIFVLKENFLLVYLANLTMFQHYFKIPNVDGSYWTLIVELVFYIFMLIILALKKLDKLETYGIIFLFFVSLYYFDPVAEHLLFRKLIAAIPLIGYFPLFFAGILLYKMKFEKRTALRMEIFILTFIIQCIIFQHCYRNRFYIALTEYILTLSVIYVIFLLFLYGKLGFIVYPITMWLGKISYTLYLLHQVIGTSFIIPVMMKVFHWKFLPSMIITIAFVCFLAHLVNRFIEQPAMLYLRARAKPFVS